MREPLPAIPASATAAQVSDVLQPWEHQGSVAALMHSVSHHALCCRAHTSAAASSAAGSGAGLSHHCVEGSEVERFIKEGLC